MIVDSQYATLARLVDRQLAVFPTHQRYLRKRFQGVGADDLAFAERLALTVEKLAGAEMDAHLDDYRFLCELVLEEEIAFRRSGGYRLASFAEAEREVYADKVFMTRYMNGLLLSQLWWGNHTNVMRFYQDGYLAGLRAGFRHLEIGPGHGLFLTLAADSETCATAQGWDVSEASIALTRRAIELLGPRRAITLSLVDMFAAPVGQFDSVVFSEVLEHLEAPAVALAAIARLLAPGGLAFINAPVNSPAPDHLSLFRRPEEIVDLVARSGLRVERTLFAPTSGATLEQARKRELAISTVVIARKPA